MTDKTPLETAVGKQMLLIDVDQLPPITPISGIKDETIDEAFARFHALNPHVYSALVTLSMQAKQKGAKVGMRLIYERLRWWAIETNGDPFRLNNNYISRYARLIMATVPELDGFFDTRELRS